MDLLSSFRSSLADGRLGTNLIAIHGVITVTVLVALVLRRLITHGGNQFVRWTKLSWLESASEVAARRALTMLSWLTTGVISAAVVGGMTYHLAGRDIRLDLRTWYDRLTL